VATTSPPQVLQSSNTPPSQCSGVQLIVVPVQYSIASDDIVSFAFPALSTVNTCK